MASLIEQLRHLLPEILPKSPDEAINGTEILNRLAGSLEGDSKEASIRATLSNLAADQTSPIAKVQGSQGYFLRDAQDIALGPEDATSTSLSEGESSEVTTESAVISNEVNSAGRDSQPEEKFRALYIRALSLNNCFPAHIEHTASSKQAAGTNRWKYPDVIYIEWTVDAKKDKELLEIKKVLGDQVLSITSVELKPWIELSTLRENFFQCVSNSKWAHRAILAIGTKVVDEVLVRELQRLANSYGVEVISYGLEKNFRDQLPLASDIEKMSNEEIDNLLKSIGYKETRIGGGGGRENLDWEHIQDVRQLNTDVRNVFSWISYSLKNSMRSTFKDFLKARDSDVI